MSAEHYLKEAILNLEQQLLKLGKELPNKIFTPLTSKYRPELGISPFLDTDFSQWYQQLIGQLRWAIELGRIEIHLPVALLAQHLATPRIGHLDQVFHIFAYVKKHLQSRIILDAAKPLVNEQSFIHADWTEFYCDAHEAISPNAPEPRGNSVIISCFVDADHAGNQVTRRSHSGIMIFCNRAPIMWYSKWQNTVETFFWIRIHCNLNRSRTHRRISLQIMHVWDPYGGSCEYVL
jgi:hypothetical protein